LVLVEWDGKRVGLHRHVNMPLSLPSLSGLWPAEANYVPIGQSFRPNFDLYFGKGSLPKKAAAIL
jgi:hypothetical protein